MLVFVSNSCLPPSPFGTHGAVSQLVHDLGSLSLKQYPTSATRKQQKKSTITISAMAIGADADMFVSVDLASVEPWVVTVLLSTHGCMSGA